MGLVAQKKTGLNYNHQGFTLLQLIVAIVLIGVMATVVMPLFSRKDPSASRQEFITKLNSFVGGARYAAIASSKIHKVIFDLSNHEAWIEELVDSEGAQGDGIYEMMKIDYVDSFFRWDENKIKFVDIFINGKNTMNSIDGPSDKVWFFVMPSGNAQAVTINFIDLVEVEEYDEASEYGLVLNPFSAQFKLYESFQKSV